MNHEYRVRINEVIRYIEDQLAQKMTLDDMAQVANFSKYHFSRIFTSIVGVTPIIYLTRKRLEKAVTYLGDTDIAILEISLLCGFESVSSFNAAFKRHYGLTPSEVRKDRLRYRNYRNNSLDHRNIDEAATGLIPYPEGRFNHLLRRAWDMKITIHELPNVEVAFVRHVGSYAHTYHAWGKLGEWAGENRLFPPDRQYIGISLDDPAVVDELACRYDACITLPPEFNRNGHIEGIQFAAIPGGTYAMYSFYDTPDQLTIAYTSLYGQWLPNSEYDPDDRHCLEFCMNNPKDDPEGKCKVDLYVPVKKRV